LERLLPRPLLFALGQVTSPVTAFLLVLAALIIASFYTSISGVVKAELFPTEVRALGVGLTYAVANAIFGGTAEYVALWLKSSDQEQWFAWYVSGMVAIADAARDLSSRTAKNRDVGPSCFRFAISCLMLAIAPVAALAANGEA
jgi:hypothetical protein